MRRRGGLNRIGLLALALVLALGVMGLAYGAWVDDVYITGTLSTSNVNASLLCGACWEEVGGIETDVADTDIDCSGGSMTLNISVTNALPNVSYYCNFTVSNIDVDPFDPYESLPIKIQSVTLTTAGSYTGITATVVPISPAGTVLDPGQSAPGKVKISVAPDAPTTPPQNPVYTLAVTVARWNE